VLAEAETPVFAGALAAGVPGAVVAGAVDAGVAVVGAATSPILICVGVAGGVLVRPSEWHDAHTDAAHAVSKPFKPEKTRTTTIRGRRIKVVELCPTLPLFGESRPDLIFI
jgi:hypothetical protein